MMAGKVKEKENCLLQFVYHHSVYLCERERESVCVKERVCAPVFERGEREIERSRNRKREREREEKEREREVEIEREK